MQTLKLARERLNVRYKGGTGDNRQNTKKKRIDQVARKTFTIATNVNYPKTFEQNFKTKDGKVLTAYVFQTLRTLTLLNTPDVQRGQRVRITGKTNSTKEENKPGQQEQPNKKKGQSYRKTNRRAPDTQVANNLRNEFTNRGEG